LLPEGVELRADSDQAAGVGHVELDQRRDLLVGIDRAGPGASGCALRRQVEVAHDRGPVVALRLVHAALAPSDLPHLPSLMSVGSDGAPEELKLADSNAPSSAPPNTLTANPCLCSQPSRRSHIAF